MSLALNHRRFTLNEYDQMIERGIIGEDDRVELIRGEILEMSPIGWLHMSQLNHLIRQLRIVEDRVLLSPQNAIRLATSEPQPDLALLKLPEERYDDKKPGPEDIVLLIEVAEHTLEYDRTIKLPLYAENGIQEYWIVNLIDGVIETHREPCPDGRYGVSQVVRPDETLSINALGEPVFKCSNLLRKKK
jgi:Uma2 family endonuclease